MRVASRRGRRAGRPRRPRRRATADRAPARAAIERHAGAPSPHGTIRAHALGGVATSSAKPCTRRRARRGCRTRRAWRRRATARPDRAATPRRRRRARRTPRRARRRRLEERRRRRAQPHDRIDHQLAGAVIGDVAAALDRARRRGDVAGGEHVAGVGRAPERDHRRVLAQEHRARRRRRPARARARALLLGEHAPVRRRGRASASAALRRGISSAREQLVEQLVVDVVQRRRRADHADAGADQRARRS